MAKTKKNKKKSNRKLAALAGGLALATTGYGGVADPSVAMAANVSTLTNPTTNKVILEEHPSDTPQHEGDNTVYGEGASQEANSAEENVVMGKDASVKVYNGSEDASFDTVIGHKANVKGSAGTAVGAAANVDSMFGGTAVGTASTAKGGQMGTAVGYMSEAIGNFATADGANAKATTAKATALGANAKATAGNAVALGQGSVADEENTVSVGKEGSERRITNVEAGVNDTDAVNVSQLKAVAHDHILINTYDSVVDEYNEDSSILAGSYNKIIIDDDGYTPVSTLGGNVIAGGGDNEIHSSWNSAIVGGRGNHTRSYSSVIVGGEDNTMDSVISSVLLGGESNTLENADNSAIIGGRGNTIKEKPPVKVPGEDYYENSYESDYNSSIIMGGQDNEIAFANNAAIVSGKDNSVSGDNAAVIGGEQNKASGKNAVAVGGIKTNAEGDYSVAMAGGSAKGENSFAFGDSAVAEKDKAIAFGNGASAKGEGSVALGSGSVATDNYTLSVGSDTQTRRITHVTAGVDDTDAVNVSQLRDAISGVGGGTGTDIDWTRINTVGSKVTNSKYSTVLGGQENSIESAENTDIIGGRLNKALSGVKDGAVVGGENNEVSGVRTVVVGGVLNTASNESSAVVAGRGNTASGIESAVVGGTENVASGHSAVAIGGNKAEASGENAVAASGGHATGKNTFAFGQHGIASNENAIAFQGEATGKNTIAIGSLSKATNENAISLLGKATGKNTVAIGTTSQATEENSVAIGPFAKSTAKSAVAVGALSEANEVNTFSVGSSSNNRRIVNVAAGIHDTDAVNVSQLKEAMSSAGSDDNKANITLNNITNEGAQVITNLADSVDDTAAVTTSDENLLVTSSKDGLVTTYDVSLNRDLNVDSLSVGDKVYISAEGFNANLQKIINVADGTVAKDSKDAINGGQLYDVKQEINTDLDGKANVTLNNITNEGQKVITDLAESVEKTSSVKAGDSNVVVDSKVDGNNTEYTVKLADDINAKSYSVGSKTYISETGINANSQKVVNVADGTVAKDSKDAINGGQLYDVKQEINTDLDGKANVTLNNITNEGQKVITDLADSVDDTAEVTNTDGNLTVSSKKEGNLTTYNVNFAKDIHADSYSVGDKTYISETGINANSQKVVNVADGTVAKDSKDAVNGGQLYDVQQNINVDLSKKADINLSNITNEGQKVITDLAESVEKTSSVKAGDSNVVVDSKVDGNNTEYTVKLADDINAKSYSVGSKTYISETGINANSQKVVNVADGTVAKDSKDAVNGGQLYDVKQEINTDLDGKANVTLNNITNEGKKVITDLADSVDDTAEVTNTDSNLTVSSKKEGNLTTYNVNLAKDIHADSYSVGDKTYISNTGINANSQKIVNVGKGEVSKDSTDAVNGSQLYEIEQIFAGDVTNKADIDLGNINIEGKKVITDLAESVEKTSSVKAGDSNVVVDSKVDGNNTEYTVKLADDINAKSYSVGDKTYISNTGINANSQKVVNVADGTVAKDSKDAVNGGQLHDVKQEINTDLDGKANVTLNNITNEGQKVITDLADSVDDTAEVTNTDGNLTVSSKKEGNLTTYNVNLADDINAKSYSVGDKTYISETGINANSQKVVNVADGTVAKDSKDAINGGQLYDVKQEINTNLDGKANVTLNNITNEGQKVITDLAESVEKTSSVKAGDSNVVVDSKVDGNNTEYTVKLADDINAKSYSVGDKTYISETGINANSQKITNVADGAVAKDSKDAINGGQLYDVKQEINTDLDGKANVTLNNITNEGKKVITDLADSVDDTAEVTNTDGNLTVSSKKEGNLTTYNVNLAKDIHADSYSVGDKTYISNTGINANSQKITNVADGAVVKDSKDAINGGQLYDVKQEINTDLDGKANVTLNNITNEGQKVITDLAESVEKTSSVKAGDSNVVVDSKVDGNNTEYTVKLADDINAKSYSVGDKTYISETGINANSQKVVNVADGTVAKDSKDAINGGQLYDVKQEINTDLDGKANVTLNNITNEGKKVITDLADSVDDTAEVTNTDGNLTVSSKKEGNLTTYNVNLAKDIHADSYSVGDKTYISETGINANSQKVVNVTDGTVAKDSKDAVNGGQLYDVQQNINVDLSKKADINLSNITNEGQKVITDLAESVEKTSSVKAGDSNVVVSEKKDGNNTEYTVKLADNINAKSFSVDGKTYISNTGINANFQKVVNVADGTVAKDSKDAVNGGQLYDVQQTISTNLDGKANISLNNINVEGKKVITDLADSVDDTAEVTNTDGNLTVSSKKEGNLTTYNVNLAKDIHADSYSVGDKTYISNTGINANSQKITNVADGAVDKDSKDAVNGSQLYEMQQSINVDLSKKADIDLSNISIDGRKVITDLADSVDDTAEVKAGDNNVVVSSKKDGNTTTYTVKLADNINAQSFSVGGNIYISSLGINANNKRIVNVAAGVDDTDAVNMAQLKEAVEKASDPLAVKYDSDEKTTITLAGNDGTTITNVKAGELSKTSTDAVNGSQLYETNQRVEQNTKDIKTLQTDVSNIKSDVTTNTTNISDLQEADKLNVKYTNTSKVEVHLGGNGGTVISNVANATNDDEAVNYGQLKDAISDIHVEADKNAVRYTDDTHEKVLFDGEDGTVLDGVADGEISEDSMEAVNGSQLYDEQEARKAADEELSKRIGFLDENKEYSFIKAGDSVSQNLEALDAAIIVKDDGNEISIAKNSATKVINVAGKGGEPRVITGVRTDENDGSSATNVDYVNQKAKEGQRYAQGIGAQAAAMATLHPLDWDKKDKVSVSASVGAYKSEVAGAVGAYYRPDRKSMVSFQGAFGKNDNMFGIGFSKKLGDQETEELTAEDAEALRTEVSDLRSKNSELEDKYEKLEAQNRQILEMLSKQSGLNATTVSAIVAPEGNEDESPADDEEIFGEEE